MMKRWCSRNTAGLNNHCALHTHDWRYVATNRRHYSCIAAAKYISRGSFTHDAVELRPSPFATPVRNFSAKPSFFKRLKGGLSSIVYGDDHIHPKKIVERKYLYYTILLTKYRQLRIERQQRETTSGTKYSSDEELYDMAADALEKQGIDTVTNVDLRKTLQSMIEPQIDRTFQAFETIDQQLGIPAEDMSKIDLVTERKCDSILLKEYEHNENLVQETKTKIETAATKTSIESSKRSLQFLERKKEAIELLLCHHGWGDPSIVSNSSNDDMDCIGTVITDDISDENIAMIRTYQTMNVCRSIRIKEQLGYSVLSLKSLLPGAGRGLFVDGAVMAGGIVGYQPGEVWAKEHLVSDDEELMEHFATDYNISICIRFDDYVVDARQSPVTVLTQPGTLNPWGIGHMSNHPPLGELPNCESIMVNYKESMKLGTFEKYIPNTYARTPSWQSRFFDSGDSVLLHSLGLLSRRDLRNEELIHDYRLQLRTDDLPSWYKNVEYHDGYDESKIVFFK